MLGTSGISHTVCLICNKNIDRKLSFLYGHPNLFCPGAFIGNNSAKRLQLPPLAESISVSDQVRASNDLKMLFETSIHLPLPLWRETRWYKHQCSFNGSVCL